MGSIKDRNRMDLTEAEDINKRLHKYSEELWTEVQDTVQTAGIKTIPQETEIQKGKMAV